ncbi:MAG: RNA polymerase Rpb4 family protein [Candidatus Micrarchaeia archaeon]
MIGKQHSEPNAVSMPEALSILEERKKEGELGYEQEITLEHVKKFAKLSKADAEKMSKELLEFGLSKKGAAKIIDVMPISVLQLKQVLIIERRNFEEETIAKIFETIEKYRKR